MASELIRCGHCGTANRVPAAAPGTPRCGKCHQPLPWIADADDATFGDIAEDARDERGRLRVGRISMRIHPELEQTDSGRNARCLAVYEDFCVVTQSVRSGLDVSVEVEMPQPTPAPDDDRARDQGSRAVDGLGAVPADRPGHRPAQLPRASASRP